MQDIVIGNIFGIGNNSRSLQIITNYKPTATTLNTSITPVDFKKHSRILDPNNTDEDAEINEFLASAMLSFEDYTNCSLITTSWSAFATIGVWCDFAITRKNISSIENIKYFPSNWNYLDPATVLPASFQFLDSTNTLISAPSYVINSAGQNEDKVIELNYNYSFPTLMVRSFNIEINFLTTPTTIDPMLKIALLSHANYLYFNRGDDNFSDYLEMNSFVKKVYNKYRNRTSANSSAGIGIL